MMSGPLTVGAAFFLGLAASGHCLVMCGGISTALGFATARDQNGRSKAALLVSYQIGRVVSYSAAGLLFAGALGGLVAVLDIEGVRRALRALAAIALLLAAFVAFGRIRDPSLSAGRRLWEKLAPLGRRLLPVASVPRALAFGMIWGWMPCGFVYSVLLIATLQSDALQGAMIMAAFGLGTMPALLVTAFGAHRISRWTASPAARYVAASALVLSAILTLIGPWIGHAMFGPHDVTSGVHSYLGHIE